ncbi:Meiotically up-regulated gene 190 protein [Rhodotorula toruloides]|nr:Meiotically up-regulated gene 190 protein [Rhodotorula toruloides]
MVLWSMMTCDTAGTELFVRDYTKTSLRIVVRDARLREHDPILGIVDLPLQKTLAHSSQVTRMYSLQGGVGWGKVNISILFKALAHARLSSCVSVSFLAGSHARRSSEPGSTPKDRFSSKARSETCTLAVAG